MEEVALVQEFYDGVICIIRWGKGTFHLKKQHEYPNKEGGHK